MEPVTVSPKFQIVIPKEVREAMGIEPGQKFMVLPTGLKTLALVPAEPISAIRGICKDDPMPPLEREPDREF